MIQSNVANFGTWWFNKTCHVGKLEQMHSFSTEKKKHTLKIKSKLKIHNSTSTFFLKTGYWVDGGLMIYVIWGCWKMSRNKDGIEWWKHEVGWRSTTVCLVVHLNCYLWWFFTNPSTKICDIAAKWGGFIFPQVEGWKFKKTWNDQLVMLYLELQTTSFLWLFQLDDSQSLHKKWLFHQTFIKRWLFRVPGSSMKHAQFAPSNIKARASLPWRMSWTIWTSYQRTKRSSWKLPLPKMDSENITVSLGLSQST